MAQTTIAYLERTMAQQTIAYLEQRYTALESEIADALRQSPTEDMAIADLKYRKTDYRGRDPTQSSLGRAFRRRIVRYRRGYAFTPQPPTATQRFESAFRGSSRKSLLFKPQHSGGKLHHATE